MVSRLPEPPTRCGCVATMEIGAHDPWRLIVTGSASEQHICLQHRAALPLRVDRRLCVLGLIGNR